MNENPNAERRPFLALLDIGLVRTTVGNRVFGALKGATDGGLYVPHNNKRFPGFSKEEDKEEYNADAHRDRIFGKHVDSYIKKISKDQDAYKKQFGNWDETLKKAGVKSVEDLFKKIHDEIRKSSDRTKKPKSDKYKRDH